MSVITFLIGNGFDLACGLKSRYSDSYDGYVKKAASDTEIIEHFKATIEKDINSWADFEMKLAEYAHIFKSEKELIECIGNYKAYLNTYLLQEQQSFLSRINNNKSLREAMIGEMSHSFLSFYSALIPNDKRAISQALSGVPVRLFQFINFNYTTVFDELEKEVFASKSFHLAVGVSIKNNPIIHIHGELNDSLVLGVDNDSQLINLPYSLSSRGKRRIIKPSFLESYDLERKKTAVAYIQRSDIICAYGLSLGDSDLSWKKALADWLLANRSNHLVFYKHSLASKYYNNDDANQKMDDEEDGKEALVRMLFGDTLEPDVYNQVFGQIHMPTGSNIFNISNVSYTIIKGADTATPPVTV